MEIGALSVRPKVLDQYHGPSVAAGPCWSKRFNRIDTVVGASAGEGYWYLFRYGGTIYEFLLLISQEECDETRT